MRGLRSKRKKYFFTIINHLKDNERIEEMMSIFNLINDDLDRIKFQINNLIDHSTKQELEEEEKLLEIKFKAGLTIQEKGGLNSNLDDTQPSLVTFNRKDAKIILEHAKKENESILKEIDSQDKNLEVVKESINKILNRKFITSDKTEQV